MKNIAFILFASCLLVFNAHAAENTLDISTPELKNYQVNNEKMVSSGLPTKPHLEMLQKIGLNQVVDLIPGDRTEHQQLISSLALGYHNIAVEWENPTLANFQEYVSIMQNLNEHDGVTLTHCRLNWRGSVFTYLYQVTQLQVPEETAKQEMLAIWQPNEIWLSFIDHVLAHYQR
ncbi:MULTISPECIES: hypothetical protein [Aliiglaciecola]|uniref:hypothetical protein n=1 Tax=Aliiglaciecola TaxID=1406885 RepID=UPI001C0A1042|nr:MULTISPECIES: hypothetical protein [Aliiglaciecola]MBU2878035.1 hypothetical protein [Aliiglaciecola lipolytica]MDO6709400.1 hypothetical protein [Aliiglaciecola sp. 2_MG-2023]MDO6750548.1 hypothetical protein [Aliiglaciecola sp. 1_MG-2023]